RHRRPGSPLLLRAGRRRTGRTGRGGADRRDRPRTGTRGRSAMRSPEIAGGVSGGLPAPRPPAAQRHLAEESVRHRAASLSGHRDVEAAPQRRPRRGRRRTGADGAGSRRPECPTAAKTLISGSGPGTGAAGSARLRAALASPPPLPGPGGGGGGIDRVTGAGASDLHTRSAAAGAGFPAGSQLFTGVPTEAHKWYYHCVNVTPATPKGGAGPCSLPSGGPVETIEPAYGTGPLLGIAAGAIAVLLFLVMKVRLHAF